MSNVSHHNMRMRPISHYLQAFGSLRSRRKGMIASSFARAIAPFEKYNEGHAKKALELLGQMPGQALNCVYCEEQATEWDHLEPIIVDSSPTWFGHTLGNLVPACAACNRTKGNKRWRSYLEEKNPANKELLQQRIERYVEAYQPKNEPQRELWEQLLTLQNEILERLEKADKLIQAARNARQSSGG